jgi:tyrosyl-tRNA synthetase
VMQAYDSVILNADVEFGGGDQKFNMLAGRDLQKKMDQPPQDVVMFKLLVGLDGKIKMSKSADNYIGITEEPKQIFGKIMSIPDSAIIEYFELTTKVSNKEIKKIKAELKDGSNPRDIKIKLAREIVSIYCGEKEAESAADEFEKVFSKKELPTNIPEMKIDDGNYNILTILSLIGVVSSKSDARRLVEQGGVRIDEAKITDPTASVAITKGTLVQVGKRNFFKIK